MSIVKTVPVKCPCSKCDRVVDGFGCNNNSSLMKMHGDYNLSDEEYLVKRAKEAMGHDIYAAKAWLITAKALFPTNFGIQFEAYGMEKAQRHVNEAARQLENMLYNFPSESAVWAEVRAITEELRSESPDELATFLREMFAKLPVEMQHRLLVTAADSCSDIFDHCRFLIVLLQRFPECVAQQGMRMVESLLAAEKHRNVTTPVNSLRKLLVYDIVPLILKAPCVDIPHDKFCRLLHKCLEFCVGGATQFHFKDTTAISHSSAILSGAMSDCEGLPTSHWHHMAFIMESIGHKLGWELWENFFSSNRDMQWQRLHSMFQMRMANMDDPSSPCFTQVLYCTSLVFLHSLYDYMMAVDPEQITGGAGENSNKIPVVLIESFHSFTNILDRPPQKKHKSELDGTDSCPTLVVDRATVPYLGNVTQNFLTALRCWDLLHATDCLAAEFNRLCQLLKLDSWLWLKSFQADKLLYKGLHQEAIHKLHSLMQMPNPWAKEMTNIRLASCYFHLGNPVLACQQVVAAAHALSKLPQGTGGPLTSLVHPGRHLVFLQFSRSAILNFCVKLLITCLQESAVGLPVHDDIALGHFLVLLQYDWPREEALFMAAIERIQKAGTFVYNLFFTYIINVDILEEFAYLTTPAGGNIVLDLLPLSTVQIAKQRAITRGVNKGAKEDFRMAIEKQIARSGENLDMLLIQFIADEQDTLFHRIL